MSLIIPVDDEVTLRLVEPQHAEEIAAAVAHSREHIGRRMPWATPEYDAESARAWIKATLKQFGLRNELPLSILERGRVVGGTGWHDWQQGRNEALDMDFGSVDLGYWLVEDAQGRGIATRTVRALLDYGFREVGLTRVTIRTQPGNAPSRAVAERLGFTLEGTLRRVFRWKNAWVDHCVYAMLAEDWLNGSSQKGNAA
ncbi:MAG: GNAT family protein [Planctomycetota bacterium]